MHVTLKNGDLNTKYYLGKAILMVNLTQIEAATVIHRRSEITGKINDNLEISLRLSKLCVA